MSLSRQLMWLLLAVFALVFAGTFVISVSNSRSYLADQLGSHAQDTATSLGLSLGTPMAAGDTAAVQSMVDAIADRGYYRSVVVSDIGGKVLAERRIDLKVEGVPGWFVAALSLPSPQADSLVMAGWRQAGKVVVQSHPGYAYRDLWAMFLRTVGWFAAAGALAVLAVTAVLRLALAPLREVEAQALAISDGQFPVLPRLPWTRELRQVVAAMNKMSEKVERMLADKVARIERIEREAYRDPVTGLPNRAQFENRLRYLLEHPDEFGGGALLLVHLAGVQDYNDRYGHEAGDALLREAGEVLSGLAAGSEHAWLARFSGAEFTLLWGGMTRPEAQALGARVGQALSELYARKMSESAQVGHVGIALADRRRISDLFAEADMALRAAQAKGPNAWHMYQADEVGAEVVHGAHDWHEILERVIDQRGVILYSQPVISCRDGTHLHHEALARIPGPEGELVAAGVFMPTAERLGLASQIDRLVVEKVLEYMERTGEPRSRSVNISAVSLRTPAFVEWLHGALCAAPQLAARLILEVPEYAYSFRHELLREFIERLRGTGCRIALDRFGVNPGSFGYLKGLKLAYVKIDGSHSADIDSNRESQFYLEVVKDIVHGLDMAVIANAVETVPQLDTYRELGFDGAQGHLFARPALLGG